MRHKPELTRIPVIKRKKAKKIQEGSFLILCVPSRDRVSNSLSLSKSWASLPEGTGCEPLLFYFAFSNFRIHKFVLNLGSLICIVVIVRVFKSKQWKAKTKKDGKEEEDEAVLHLLLLLLLIHGRFSTPLRFWYSPLFWFILCLFPKIFL